MYTLRALANLHYSGGTKHRGETFEVDQETAFEMLKNGGAEVVSGDDASWVKARQTEATESQSLQLVPVPARPQLTDSDPKASPSSRSTTRGGSAQLPSDSTRLISSGGVITSQPSVPPDSVVGSTVATDPVSQAPTPESPFSPTKKPGVFARRRAKSAPAAK